MVPPLLSNAAIKLPAMFESCESNYNCMTATTEFSKSNRHLKQISIQSRRSRVGRSKSSHPPRRRRGVVSTLLGKVFHLDKTAPNRNFCGSSITMPEFSESFLASMENEHPFSEKTNSSSAEKPAMTPKWTEKPRLRREVSHDSQPCKPARRQSSDESYLSLGCEHSTESHDFGCCEKHTSQAGTIGATSAVYTTTLPGCRPLTIDKVPCVPDRRASVNSTMSWLSDSS